MKKYFVFFVIAWTIFIFHAIHAKHAIYGDGNGYYCYTQAIFFDKSLNFTNIYNYLGHFPGRDFEFSRIFWNEKFNPYSIGTGIIWIPSMFLMSLFSSDRFNLIYELGPGLTGIISIIFGLFFIEKYLSRRFSAKTVFWTILTLFFGSSVFYYTGFEPALSHQPAFLIMALLFYLTDKENVNIFLVGFLSGILAATRIGDSLLLIPLLLKLRGMGFKLIYFIPGALIGYTPQLINQYLQFGSLIHNPYLSGENGSWQVNFLSIANVLFSPKRGLFTWTPLFLLAIYGLIKNRHLILTLIILVFLLVTSFWPGGFSAGFGIRLIFSAIPYLAIGVAEVFSKLNDRKVIKYSLFFSAYNFLLLYGFYFLGWKYLP